MLKYTKTFQMKSVEQKSSVRTEEWKNKKKTEKPISIKMGVNTKHRLSWTHKYVEVNRGGSSVNSGFVKLFRVKMQPSNPNPLSLGKSETVNTVML